MSTYDNIFSIPEWRLDDYQGPLKFLDEATKAPARCQVKPPIRKLYREPRVGDRLRATR